MGHRQRFVVEAEWSGYHSNQRRVCHRTVETLFRVGYESIGTLMFSDGTYLTVTVRDAKPREKVQQIHSYDELLHAAAVKAWNNKRNAA